MKIRDLILMMSNKTEIIIYSDDEEYCAMLGEGDCADGPVDDDVCEHCLWYTPEKLKFTKYHGTAGECPIKLAERDIVEINNAYYEVDVGSGKKRKFEKRQMIAIKVKGDDENDG